MIFASTEARLFFRILHNWVVSSSFSTYLSRSSFTIFSLSVFMFISSLNNIFAIIFLLPASRASKSAVETSPLYFEYFEIILIISAFISKGLSSLTIIFWLSPKMRQEFAGLLQKAFCRLE